MAAPAMSSRLQELVRRSVDLHQSGRLDEAEALYRQVLQSDPANPDALNLLGVLIAQRGRPAEAAQLIREAMVLYRKERLQEKTRLVELPVLVGHRPLHTLPPRGELYDEIFGEERPAR